MPTGQAGPVPDAKVEVNEDKTSKPVNAGLPKEPTNPKDNPTVPKKIEQVEMQNRSEKDVKTEEENAAKKEEK